MSPADVSVQNDVRHSSTGTYSNQLVPVEVEEKSLDDMYTQETASLNQANTGDDVVETTNGDIIDFSSQVVKLTENDKKLVTEMQKRL